MRTVWYELVDIDDTIVCLGDVGVDSSIGVDHQEWWREAPGAKWVALGNHDERWSRRRSRVASATRWKPPTRSRPSSRAAAV